MESTETVNRRQSVRFNERVYSISIPWLEATARPRFPETAFALAEPPGLLAAGGSLDVAWLLAAYRQGIFPYFSENESILWWSPSPRTVLYPHRLHQSRSLLKLARQKRYVVTKNHDFESVIHACARADGDKLDYWIHPLVISAYIEMHRAGFAHSIECWNQQNTLVGGLYGVALGAVFFGESMFSIEANTSKLCLKRLAESGEFEMIDCQLATGHLKSLGAIEIDRAEFESQLRLWAQDQHAI